MKTRYLIPAAAILATAAVAFAQSPAATESTTINGKTITIAYASPRVNGREGKIFSKGGLISHDQTYPVWRAGANSATKFHTDADLQIGSLVVPKGDYTLFVDISDPAQWQLVINKQTGQWGLTYNKGQDLGRVPMQMSKPSSLVENLKYTLAKEGGNKARLTLEWENVRASVPVVVQ